MSGPGQVARWHDRVVQKLRNAVNQYACARRSCCAVRALLRLVKDKTVRSQISRTRSENQDAVWLSIIVSCASSALSSWQPAPVRYMSLELFPMD